ncbi:phage major capsid protein [Clostridium beijerinckii]|uniref:Phage major capsid protein n=1 Tax=Clostridium beijerinckii TaxID=1520 RepID=A0AAW3WAB3_CLOBE|nr:phage major capsid protein [Clostridium beijerinckii]MBC2456133.1 phage major capsid protein [Clostridium beijerinckii]MBC2475418.1 phage major capsid protein [Clostridium beijerinckii]NOV63473.1 HK97 family phage major capsid protein [Clostridium beijerinckii]NOV69561.1 HK97 family phage major capsid protein [Clostridium beijerinckii]NOW31530.1 HK97 family phage major capsid protein [Clostridium beijerinckii]
MKKSIAMKNNLEKLKNEAQVLLDNNKVEDAKNKMEEVRTLKAAIEVQEELEQEEEAILAAEAEAEKESEEGSTKDSKNKTKENANMIRAMIKKVTGKKLTEAENALILPTTTAPEGTNGEGYILPQDIRTLIQKKIRQYKSLRDVLGYMPVGALTGSFPVENFETVSGLVDFADGTDGEDEDEIKFKNVKFSLQEKAAFIKLSNTLLSLTDNALINYVVDVFARKAVVTENTMGLAALKSNKTVKTIADWKALKSSINKDLDPGVLFGTVIVTNQDGFDVLDAALDSFGRPILQPNPANPTQNLFKGYPVVVYSNTMLPTTNGKAPIIYGNLSCAVCFVDLNGQIAFATSSEAGFMSNTTIARLIEFIDVVQCDSSDKCYIYGELAVGASA